MDKELEERTTERWNGNRNNLKVNKERKERKERKSYGQWLVVVVGADGLVELRPIKI